MYMGKWTGVLVATLTAFGLALTGCGLDFDDDDDDLRAPTVPLVFNDQSAEPVARASAGIVEIFPDLSRVILEVFQPFINMAVGREAAARVAADPVPLGDLGLCSNSGTSILTWDDTDNDGVLEVGETATLVFNACALDVANEVLDGTLTFTFTTVVLPINIAADVVTSPSLVLTDLNDNSTETLTMDFGLQVLQSVPTEVTLIYGDPLGTDTIRLDGSEFDVQFGCFDVTHTIPLPIDPISPQFTLAPRGIVNLTLKNTFLGGIMQVGRYPPAAVDTPLDFAGLTLSPGGTLTLFNFDDRPSAQLPACAAVGSTGAAPASVSAELITATGSIDITIDLFEDTALTMPVGSTIFTTWSALIN